MQKPLLLIKKPFFSNKKRNKDGNSSENNSFEEEDYSLDWDLKPIELFKDAKSISSKNGKECKDCRALERWFKIIKFLLPVNCGSISI